MLLLANTSKTKIIFGDQNLTPYNHSKNRSAWRDIECNKRFGYISPSSLIGFEVEWYSSLFNRWVKKKYKKNNNNDFAFWTFKFSIRKKKIAYKKKKQKKKLEMIF